MLYVDTSAVVKLYIQEEYSVNVSHWLRKNDEAIPWTALHELEFTNAIHLKEFRGEVTPEETRLIRINFTAHEQRGVYYRPELDWADAFGRAIDLSTRLTIKTGSRSLDVLHIGAALLLGANGILTFDERQATLATLEGMEILDISAT